MLWCHFGIYYLDRRHSLELLVQHGRLSEIHSQMEDELRMNHDADYAGAVIRGQHMKLGFLQHSLMISRMHFMLEMASRSGKGLVELAAWRQGAESRGNKVHVPEIRSRRMDGTNDYAWEERDETIRLPVEPDAMFSLGAISQPGWGAFHGSIPLVANKNAGHQ
jgi:hypothetical protein